MAGELAAEWIKIPDGNGNLQKVWVRDSTARRDIAQLQTDVSGLVIPDPSDASPQMDGTAAAGSSADYSRADHVHPTDTSRQAALSQAQLDAANSGITAAKVAAYDAIQVPTATSELTNDSGFITASAVPNPSSTAPQMDGVAAVGSSIDFARADHVHPSDTSKQDTLSQGQLDAVNSGITAEIVGQILPYLGQFTGNINSSSITPGIYYLHGFSITLSGGATSFYGTFIQFPGTFKVQMVIGGPNGAGGIIESRRYLTGSSSFTNWA